MAAASPLSSQPAKVEVSAPHSATVKFAPQIIEHEPRKEDAKPSKQVQKDSEEDDEDEDDDEEDDSEVQKETYSGQSKEELLKTIVSISKKNDELLGKLVTSKPQADNTQDLLDKVKRLEGTHSFWLLVLATLITPLSFPLVFVESLHDARKDLEVKNEKITSLEETITELRVETATQLQKILSLEKDLTSAKRISIPVFPAPTETKPHSSAAVSKEGAEDGEGAMEGESSEDDDDRELLKETMILASKDGNSPDGSSAV